MRVLLLAAIFFVSCGDFVEPGKPGSPGEEGAPGEDGSPGEEGAPGEDGAAGSGAIIKTVSCSFDWKYEDTEETKRGVLLTYIVMTFETGDVLAGLTRNYYNNAFTQKQNVTALWPKEYALKDKAHVGDSVFSAYLEGDLAIITLQATGEKKEVSCAATL